MKKISPKTDKSKEKNLKEGPKIQKNVKQMGRWIDDGFIQQTFIC